MSWQEIVNKGHALTTQKSMERALVFKQTALDRMDFVRQHSITRERANFILQGYYDCIQDQVRCLAALRGFTIATPIASIYFLKEVLEHEPFAKRLRLLSEIHDSARILGKEVQYEKTSESIEQALRLIEDLHTVVKKGIDEFTEQQIASGKISL